jgi:hypothetical protein
LQFADQPHRVAEALRAIEGILRGTICLLAEQPRELLTRRLPKTQHLTLG